MSNELTAHEMIKIAAEICELRKKSSSQYDWVYVCDEMEVVWTPDKNPLNDANELRKVRRAFLEKMPHHSVVNYHHQDSTFSKIWEHGKTKKVVENKDDLKAELTAICLLSVGKEMNCPKCGGELDVHPKAQLVCHKCWKYLIDGKWYEVACNEHHRHTKKCLREIDYGIFGGKDE